MPRNVGRISGLRAGDRVRTTADVAKSGWEVLPAGTACKLGQLYRIQDGLEVWAIWVGPRLWCAAHTKLERVSDAA